MTDTFGSCNTFQPWLNCHSCDGGGGGESGGGGSTGTLKSPGCTAFQQKATQLAQGFEAASTASEWIAFGTGVGSVLSGAGEGLTFGADTPVTISFGSLTLFFGTASTLSSGAASALNSMASGNTTAVENFGWSQLTNLAATAAASKIPLLKPWAERIGDLASQGADLALKTQEVCH